MRLHNSITFISNALYANGFVVDFELSHTLSTSHLIANPHRNNNMHTVGARSYRLKRFMLESLAVIGKLYIRRFGNGLDHLCPNNKCNANLLLAV